MECSPPHPQIDTGCFIPLTHTHSAHPIQFNSMCSCIHDSFVIVWMVAAAAALLCCLCMCVCVSFDSFTWNEHAHMHEYYSLVHMWMNMFVCFIHAAAIYINSNTSICFAHTFAHNQTEPNGANTIEMVHHVYGIRFECVISFNHLNGHHCLCVDWIFPALLCRFARCPMPMCPFCALHFSIRMTNLVFGLDTSTINGMNEWESLKVATFIRSYRSLDRSVEFDVLSIELNMANMLALFNDFRCMFW